MTYFYCSMLGLYTFILIKLFQEHSENLRYIFPTCGNMRWNEKTDAKSKNPCFFRIRISKRSFITVCSGGGGLRFVLWRQLIYNNE